MRLADYAERLIGLSRAVYAWAGEAAAADRGRREKAALYAEEVAATLGRAAGALVLLDRTPEDRPALLAATRELGRIAGYVETMMGALEQHLDGRKRAGVKRRLDYLEPFDLEAALSEAGAFRQARRFASAEGFFRALADALRV
ncbi:MAG: hypothetical protein ACT4OU_09280 [Hyphomicrobium sp.]